MFLSLVVNHSFLSQRRLNILSPVRDLILCSPFTVCYHTVVLFICFVSCHVMPCQGSNCFLLLMILTSNTFSQAVIIY